MRNPAHPDSPPSYHAILLTDEDHPPEKSNFNDTKTQPLPSGSSLASSQASSFPGKSVAGSSNNWLNIRTSIQDLLRDLVRRNTQNSPAAVSILTSCAHACAMHGVSFSDLLQQQYIEKRTILYWVVVKQGLPDNHPEVEENKVDFLTALMSYAIPLKGETITEIRQACLAASDQNLFRRLSRQSPGFARMSVADEMLLGTKVPVDEIEMEEMPATSDSFAVHVVVPQFHKRMAISKEIPLEFIARRRLWRLTFFEAPASHNISAPPAGWVFSLSLQETSPPTHVVSSLAIHEAAGPSPSEEPFTIKFNTSKQLQSGYRIQHSLGTFQAKLESANSPFIRADGSLCAKFEARLGKL